MLRDYTSFDLIATANLTEGLFTSVNTGSSALVAVSAGTGRRGTNSLRLSNSGDLATACNVRRTLDAQATWGVGFAFRMSNVAKYARDIFAVRDGGTAHVDVVVNLDGTLSATRNGTVLGTTSVALSSAAYYFLEVRVVIHSSAGAVKIRLNNAVVLNLTGINTQATGNASANELVFGNVRLTSGLAGTGATLDYDDLHIYDGQAGAVTDCLGDCRVDALRPIADVSTAFTPSSGSARYAMVDDSTPNGDTDYNESTTVGAVDRFTFETLPALSAPTIYAVKVTMYARNPQPGVRTLTAQAHSGATSQDGASHSLGGTYLLYNDLFETDPATSAAWADQAAVNNATFGYKVAS
jgi:hypothetical protein